MLTSIWSFIIILTQLCHWRLQDIIEFKLWMKTCGMPVGGSSYDWSLFLMLFVYTNHHWLISYHSHLLCFMKLKDGKYNYLKEVQQVWFNLSFQESTLTLLFGCVFAQICMSSSCYWKSWRSLSRYRMLSFIEKERANARKIHVKGPVEPVERETIKERKVNGKLDDVKAK